MRYDDAKELYWLLRDDAGGNLTDEHGYAEMLRLRDEWESSPTIDEGRMTQAQRERLGELDALCDEADDADWSGALDAELRKLAALSMTDRAACALEQEVQRELARDDAHAAAGRALGACYRRARAAYVEKFGKVPRWNSPATTTMQSVEIIENAIATGRELVYHPGAIG